MGWSGTDVLVVDMPPRTGEEARGLLQLRPSIAVVATAPQLISESAVRKVVEMASEYRMPLLGFLENQHNGVTGEAGHDLAMKVSEVGIAVHSLAAGVHLDHSRRCGMDFLNPFFPGCCSCGAKGPLLPEVPPAEFPHMWPPRVSGGRAVSGVSLA